MKVTEFFLGFGPRVWSFRRGETEYGVKAIPAGGYVRIIGMSNLEEVDPEDEPRTYRQAPFGKPPLDRARGRDGQPRPRLLPLLRRLVGQGSPAAQTTTLRTIVAGTPAGRGRAAAGRHDRRDQRRSAIEAWDAFADCARGPGERAAPRSSRRDGQRADDHRHARPAQPHRLDAASSA